MHEGIDEAAVAVLAASIVAWGLVSARLERWNISAPIFFVLVGLVVANGPTSILDLYVDSHAVLSMAEVALAVVLFGDASTVELAKLRRDAALPSRLLLLGLPLTVAAGTVAAHWLLPGLSWWVCAVIGAAVAPTDAALGAAILEDERVPAKVRRVLNVESGLNDGIATPIVNCFLVVAVAGTAFEISSTGHAIWGLALGALVGVLVGLVGGLALDAAAERGLGSAAVRPVATGALAILAYAGVVAMHGNGFVAAFVAGLAYGHATDPKEDEPALAFTHDAGRVLSSAVWFLFGALMVPILRDADWRAVAFAVAALTVVRMVPVALVLIGAGFDRATVGIIGWFGPRGLASVVFALIAADVLAPAEVERTVSTIAVTVLLSVVLHGVTAGPLARRYAATRPRATSTP